MPRPARLALGSLAAVAICAGCGDDGDTDLAPGEVDLLEAGEGQLAELPAPYDRGQSAASDVSISQEVTGPGLDLDIKVEISTEGEVVSVEGGQATVEEQVKQILIDTGEVDVDSPELDQLTELKGAVIATIYDEDGHQVGDGKRVDGGSLPGEFEDLTSQGAELAFPDELVGVGARWVVGTEVESEVVTLESEVTYELTELTEDGYEIELSGETPIDEEVDGSEFSGEVAEHGGFAGIGRTRSCSR